MENGQPLEWCKQGIVRDGTPLFRRPESLGVVPPLTRRIGYNHGSSLWEVVSSDSPLILMMELRQFEWNIIME